MSVNLSKHAFGSKDRVEQALLDGKISPFDVVLMANEGENVGELAWVNKDGELIHSSPSITVKTKNEWINSPDYVPLKGEIVVYSDYNQVIENGATQNVPAIKIGDGINPIRLLSFVTAIGTMSRLSHTLTIGSHVFDGTQDVEVSVYDGTVNNGDE